MSTLRIELDGRLLPTSEHSSLDDAQITVRRQDDNGGVAFGYSGNITFYGQAARYLIDRLINDANARLNTIFATITDECCAGRVVFRGKITYEQIDYCEIKDGKDADCQIDAGLAETSEDATAVECLRRHIISDNRLGFRNRVYPFVRYCIEPMPVITYVVMLVMANAILSIGVALLIVLSPIIAIVQALNRLPGVNIAPGGNPNIFRTITDLLRGLAADAVGCGRGHPTPYLRDYIQNACDLCGLDFQSSILTDPNSPYYNTLYFFAPNQEGNLDNDAAARAEYWELNGPIESSFNFIQKVCNAFNAAFAVQGNTLVIERKDYFVSPQLWVDFTDPARRRATDEICYRYTDSGLPNYAKLQAEADGSDWVGTQALRKHYSAIVDYEPPINPNLNGERLYNLPYGPARFRNDNVRAPAISPIILTAIGILSPIGGAITASIINSPKYRHVLLMQAGTAFAPKYLLRVRSGDTDDNALVERRPTNRAGRFDYNTRFWPTPGEGLYEDYFEWESPNANTQSRGLEYSVRFRYKCEDLPINIADILNYRVRLPLQGQVVEGSITSITFASNRTVTINGLV